MKKKRLFGMVIVTNQDTLRRLDRSCMENHNMEERETN